MSKEDKAREDRMRYFEEHESELAQAFVESHVELADKIYSQAINSLWLGNSGAALATLSFMGAAWKNGGFPTALLWPLGCFTLGVISMGVGTLVALTRERRVIARNQNAKSVLDLMSRDSQSPLERAGLAPDDWRMRLAVISGGCFVVGCVVGFVLLAFKAN